MDVQSGWLQGTVEIPPLRQGVGAEKGGSEKWGMLGGDCLQVTNCWPQPYAARCPPCRTWSSPSPVSLVDLVGTGPQKAHAWKCRRWRRLHVVLTWRSGSDLLFSELVIRVRVPCSGKSQTVKQMVRAGRVHSRAALVTWIPVFGDD